jgi:hypothetical protein
MMKRNGRRGAENQIRARNRKRLRAFHSISSRLRRRRTQDMSLRLLHEASSELRVRKPHTHGFHSYTRARFWFTRWIWGLKFRLLTAIICIVTGRIQKLIFLEITLNVALVLWDVFRNMLLSLTEETKERKIGRQDVGRRESKINISAFLTIDIFC